MASTSGTLVKNRWPPISITIAVLHFPFGKSRQRMSDASRTNRAKAKSRSVVVRKPLSVPRPRPRDPPPAPIKTTIGPRALAIRAFIHQIRIKAGLQSRHSKKIDRPEVKLSPERDKGRGLGLHDPADPSPLITNTIHNQEQ